MMHPSPKILRALLVVLVLAAGLPAAHAAETSPGWSALLAGDHEAALAAFAEELAADPGRLEAAIGAAALEEARGATDPAARHLLRAAESGRDGLLGAGVLARTFALAADLRDGGEIAQPVLERLVDGTLHTPEAELRSMAALALADILARSGDPDAGRTLLFEQAGRLSHWSVLGPYGKFEQLAFDRVFGPEQGDLSPADDGQALPARPARRIDTTYADGRVTVPDALEGTGAYYAVTDLVVSRAVDARIRVGSHASMKVFFDGDPVLRFDRMRERPPFSRSFRVSLEPGRHRLLVKFVRVPGSSPLTVTILSADGGSLGPSVRSEHPTDGSLAAASFEALRCELDARARQAAGSADPAEVVAASWWLIARQLSRDLGNLLERAHERWPDTPLFALWLGEYFFKAETGAAPEEDLARARGLIEASVEAAPDLVRGHGLLAEMEFGAGHLDQAWDLLERGLERDPDQPDLLLAQHGVARRRGWSVEAAARIEHALEIAPGRNDVLKAAIDFYSEHGAVQRLEPLLAEQARRYTRGSAPPEPLYARGQLEQAAVAWRELTELEPGSSYGWIGWVRTLVQAREFEAARQGIEQARLLFPGQAWIDELRGGVLAWSGADKRLVNEALERALEDNPAQLGLRETIHRRGKPDPLERWLVDPREILEKAEDPVQAVDSALLADIAVTLVDARGGQTELYQGVHQVYTRAGVEQEGELQVLPGARIDRIRVHKADGRVVDVAPGGKRPISLPALEPGDAFEYVWTRYTPPLDGIPGALDNSTIFLFQGEDRDYVLSRFVVIHDESLPVQACTFDAGLETEDFVENGLRIRSWTARSMPRIRPEPHVADRYEVTPHVRLAYGLSWEDVGDMIRTALVGKLRTDEPLPAFLDEIRSESASDDPLALARALHLVVNRKVEPGRTSLDLSAPASVGASAGEGNRLGIALALGSALGLEPRLVLARPIELSRRELDCPMTYAFPYALLRIDTAEREIYLDYTGADHAFDTIPLQIAGSTGLLVPLDPDVPVEMIDIPRRDPGVLQDQFAEVTLHGDGSASGRLRIHLEGPMASTTRQVLAGVPAQQMQRVEQGIAAQSFPGARVTAFEITGLDDPDASLTMELEFEDGSLARRTPSGLALPVARQPLGLFDEFASLPSRRFAMLFAAQALRRDRMVVHVPPELILEREFEPIVIDNPFGTYRLEASWEDGVVEIERLVKLPPRRIEVEEYSEFRSMARTIDQVEQRELRVVAASPALAQPVDPSDAP